MTNNDHTLTPPRVASPDTVQVAAETKRRWPTAVRTVLVIPAALLCYAPLLLLQFPTEGLARQGNWGLVTVITMVPFVLMTLTAVFLVWLLMHFLDRRPLWQAGIRVRRQDPAALALGIAVSLVAEFAIRLVAVRAGWVPVEGDNGSMAPLWGQLVVIVLGQGFLMQGIPEELFFRGYLTQTLGGGRVRRAVIAALVFGSIHIVSNGGEGPLLDRVVYCGHAAAFGFAAAALYFATGSLWAAIGIHGGLHLGSFLASMNHAGEANTSWLIGSVIYLVVGIAALAWCRRRDLSAASPAVTSKTSASAP